MKVTPLIVRHLKTLPWRMPYWLTLRLVRFIEPFLSAGMVATSPTSSVPIGYIIGLATISPALSSWRRRTHTRSRQ